MRRVPEARAVEQHGFEGDRHQRRAVGHKRQVLLVDEAQRAALDVPLGALKESWGRRGQLARVLKAGTVREGDPVRLLDVNPDAPRVIRPKLP
ncbi:hypothetical protein D7X12_00515 [Corallococcus sicarius]|uniref:MOSC domain-containing protein n=2 Tax=Corallococcus sicarius TaxID=2316726 RepID=A0A3A8NW67_9BACT|nr:hypothetical protein D7X12_00515 [Corallococcus sicarius]